MGTTVAGPSMNSSLAPATSNQTYQNTNPINQNMIPKAYNKSANPLSQINSASGATDLHDKPLLHQTTNEAATLLNPTEKLALANPSTQTIGYLPSRPLHRSMAARSPNFKYIIQQRDFIPEKTWEQQLRQSK